MLVLATLVLLYGPKLLAVIALLEDARGHPRPWRHRRGAA